MKQAALDLLAMLRRGAVLKVHRTLDGAKVYRLHEREVAGEPARETVVAAGLVDSLVRGGYLQSNMKFPAATLLLTEKGLAATAPVALDQPEPAGPRCY